MFFVERSFIQRGGTPRHNIMLSGKCVFACVPGKQLFLSDFVTSSGGFGDAHAEAAHYAMQSHLVRHSHSIQQRAHLVCTLHKEWENYARYALINRREVVAIISDPTSSCTAPN